MTGAGSMSASTACLSSRSKPLARPGCRLRAADDACPASGRSSPVPRSPRSAPVTPSTKGRDFAAWLGLGARDRSRPATARSWARYPSAAIKLPAGRCSCRPPVGCAPQARQLGAPRPQALDRGGRQAAAPQRAGDCARQQARSHRLECFGSWAELGGVSNSDCVTFSRAADAS